MALLKVHPIVKKLIRDTEKYNNEQHSWRSYGPKLNDDESSKCYEDTIYQFYTNDKNIDFCGACYGYGHVTEDRIYYGKNNIGDPVTCTMCCCEKCGDLRTCECNNEEQEICDYCLEGDIKNINCYCYDLEGNRKVFLDLLNDRKKIVFPLLHEMCINRKINDVLTIHDSMWSSNRWFNYSDDERFHASFIESIHKELSNVLVNL